MNILSKIKQIEKDLDENKSISKILLGVLSFKDFLKKSEANFIKTELEGYKFPPDYTLKQIKNKLPSHRIKRGFLHYAPNACQAHLTKKLYVDKRGKPVDDVSIKVSIEELEQLRKKGLTITYSDPSFKDMIIFVPSIEIEEIIRTIKIRTKEIIGNIKKRCVKPKKNTLNYKIIFLICLIILVVILSCLSVYSYYTFFPKPNGDCHLFSNNSANFSEFRTINNGDTDYDVEYSVTSLWELDIGTCIMDPRTYVHCREDHKSSNSYLIKCSELPMKQSLIIKCIGNLNLNQTLAIRYNSKYSTFQYNCRFSNNSFIYQRMGTNHKFHKIFNPLIDRIISLLIFKE